MTFRKTPVASTSASSPFTVTFAPGSVFPETMTVVPMTWGR